MQRLVRALFKPQGAFYELLAILTISAAINLLTNDEVNLERGLAATLMLAAGVICHFFSTWVEWVFGEARDRRRLPGAENKTQEQMAVEYAILLYKEEVKRRLSRDLVQLAIAAACATSSVMILFLHTGD